VAEDFFLRFGAIVSTVRINQAALKSASDAIKSAIGTKAAVDIDVNFKQGDAKLVVDQIKKIQKEASDIFGKARVGGGSATPKQIELLVKNLESVRAASVSVNEALKLININPSSFKGAENIKTELLKLQQELRVLRREGEAKVKINFDEQALDRALEKTQRLKTSIQSRQNVLGSAISQYIRARSTQEEQRVQLSPGYVPQSRFDIRAEALAMFKPKSAKDLDDVNNLINKVRAKTQDVTSAVFEQTKAVKEQSKEERIRVANAERLFAIEQQIQKTIEREVASESARVKLAAAKGIAYTPKSRADIEASIRSSPEVAGALGSGQVSRLQTMQANAVLRAQQETALRSERQALKEVNALESNKSRLLDQEEKKRSQIRKNLQDVYDTLSKINTIAAKSGGQYNPLSKRDLAQRALDVSGLNGVDISTLSGGRLDSTLGATKKKTKEAKEAMAEFKDMLRGVERGTVSPLQFISRFGDSFQRLGAQVTLATQRILGYVVGASAVYGTIAFIRQSTEEFFALEQQLTKVAQTMERTGNAKERATQLSGFVKSTGAELGIEPSKLASGISTLAQAGYTDVAQIEEAIRAVSEAQLGPSFGNQEQIIDGLIATYRQFNLTLSDTRTILDVINQFSKEYAVESKDIFEIIKRGGSAFSVLGGSFEGFVKISSALRQETRESASAIGTSLKTITTSLFKPKFEKFLFKLDPKILEELDPERRLFAVSKAFGKLNGPSEKVAAIQEFIDVRNAPRVLALFQALSKEADNLNETASRAAGSILRDAIIKLDTVGNAIDRAKISLQNAAINLYDNPFAVQFIKTVSGFSAGVGNLLASKVVGTVTAPAIAGTAIYALTNIIRSSIQTYLNLINSNNKLALNLEKLNASMAILNNSFVAYSGKGSIIAGGVGGAAGSAGGGAKGIFGKIGGFFGTNLGQSIAGFVGSSFIDQISSSVQESNPGAAGGLKIASGGLQGFAISRALGLGTKGTIGGSIIGAGIEAYNQYSQMRATAELEQQRRQQEIFSRRTLETRKFISTGSAGKNFQATFGPQIEKYFIDRTQSDEKLLMLMQSIVTPTKGRTETEADLRKFLPKVSGKKFSESELKDIITNLTEPGGEGAQAKELLMQTYKFAAIRAQQKGLFGKAREDAVKGEINTLLQRSGVSYKTETIDSVFKSLSETIGDTTGVLINFEEAMTEFKNSSDMAAAAVLSSLKISTDAIERKRELRAGKFLGSTQLQNIFDSQRFFSGEGASLPSTATTGDLAKLGFGGLANPALQRRASLINDFVNKFRASPESGALLSRFNKKFLQGVEGQATESNITTRTDVASEIQDITTIKRKIEDYYGFIKKLAPDFYAEILKNPFAIDLEELGKLIQSGEVRPGEKMLRLDEMRAAAIDSINAMIRDQNDALKQSNDLAELNLQKRFQAVDIEMQIAKIRSEGAISGIDISQSVGLLGQSDAAKQKAGALGNLAESFMNTSLFTGGKTNISTISYLNKTLVDVQKNFKTLSGNVQSNSYLGGQNSNNLLGFATYINSVISNSKLNIKGVNVKETNPQNLLADTMRAFNEAKSEIPKIAELFNSGLDVMKQKIMVTVQDIQSRIQSGTGFIKDMFSQVFGGTMEQSYTAQFDIQQARDAISGIVTELQSRGIGPSDLENQKNLLTNTGIQSFAEDIVSKLFGSQELGKVIDLAKRAGSNTFGTTGYTGEEILNLITLAGGKNKIQEMTGFGMDFASLYTDIETSIKDLATITNDQITAQKDAINIIQNQTTLISESTSALAKALESIPETIKVQISGVDKIDLTLRTSTAKEDMDNIKAAVTDQVVEYIRRALETSGIMVPTLGAPGVK